MSGLNARMPPGVVVSTPYTDAVSRPRMTYPFLYEPPAMWSLQNENPAMYRSVDVSNFLITPKSYSSFNRRLLAEEYGNELDLDVTDQRVIGPAPRRPSSTANGKRERFDTEEEARDEEYRRVKRPTAVAAREEILEPPLPLPLPLPPKELGPAPPLSGPGLQASLEDYFKYQEERDREKKRDITPIIISIQKQLANRRDLVDITTLAVKLEKLVERGKSLPKSDPYNNDQRNEARRILADIEDVKKTYNSIERSQGEVFKQYRNLSSEDRDYLKKEVVQINNELDGLDRWDKNIPLVDELEKKITNTLSENKSKFPSPEIYEKQPGEMNSAAEFSNGRRTSNRLGGERPTKRKNKLGP
jgi:hypothetical protein